LIFFSSGSEPGGPPWPRHCYVTQRCTHRARRQSTAYVDGRSVHHLSVLWSRRWIPPGRYAHLLCCPTRRFVFQTREGAALPPRGSSWAEVYDAIRYDVLLVEERKGCSGKDLQRSKVLSLERKSGWVMKYQITVSMTVGR